MRRISGKRLSSLRAAKADLTIGFQFPQRTCPLKKPAKRLLFPILLLFISVDSQTSSFLQLNSSFSGTTVGAQRGLFSNVKKIDIKEPDSAAGGQLIITLMVPDLSADLDLHLSTCVGSEYSTYLALLDDNPLNATEVSVLAESSNDITCVTGREKAFLSTRLSAGIYYVLVSGSGDAEGVFNLSATGVSASENQLSWGLDRIDQRENVLDQTYTVQGTGGGIWVYVIDSGIRISHEEFENRAIAGFDFVNNRQDSAEDCTGHGTHVAGVIGGKNTGVSSNAKLVGIKIFGCNNQARLSALVDAIGWILVDSKINDRLNVVVAMMFSAPLSSSKILGSTVQGMIRSGIPVIVPAGNNGGSACDYYPGSLEAFLTVGATDISDYRISRSNSGNCTTFYAPGSSILSAWHTSNTARKRMTGTAQAAAHMTGIVASLLSINKGLSAELVNTVLSSISTVGVVNGLPPNDTARFSFIRSVPKFEGDPPPEQHIFLFAILKILTPSCSAESTEISALRNEFTKRLSLKASQFEITCVADLQPSLHRATEDIKFVQIRAEVPERKASAAFITLERSLLVNKGSTEDALGFGFSVPELPWSVDSSSITFWGAPSFSEGETSSLSVGAIAGAAVGGTCLLVILMASLWVLYRRVTEVDYVESMEGSADFEKGPVHFDDFSDAKEDDSATVPRSFRNAIRGMSFKGHSGLKHSISKHSSGIGGLNKMGSFIGGPKAGVGKDIVRLHSFGGEAFADMNVSSRQMPRLVPGKKTHENSSSTDGMSSFRGVDNLVLQSAASQSGEGEFQPSASMDESMRMQSLGGEAFAKIGGGNYGDTSPSGSSQSFSGFINSGAEQSSSRREAVSPFTNYAEGSEREMSFFGNESLSPTVKK